MEELDYFKKNIESQIKKAFDGNVVLFSFLDLSYGAILEKYAKKYKVPFYKYGHIINSERNRYILSYYDVSKDDFKIDLFKIKYNNKFTSINHRNVLGKLISLGIERDSIGDIIFQGDDIFFAIKRELRSFILNDFNDINNAKIELELVDIDIENIIKYEDKNYFVSSLRLDCIISSIYNISRNDTKNIIINGDVYINNIVCMNPITILKENDIVSVRHKGKFKFTSINGKSRSDRFNVTLSRRI